jgi:hypothetical protein
MIFSTDITSLSDTGLRLTAVHYHLLGKLTGDVQYHRLADAADDERMRRMLAAPNPYEEVSHARAKACAAGE